MDPLASRKMIGSLFSHYRVLELLGAGGMGAVYRAHDNELDRDVALKVLQPEGYADATARARLLREARTAAQLNHPHICTIYEVGEADGQLYIAMELVHGQPLNSLIPSGGLPQESVLRYGVQIADALMHAHEHGVIHRDLKTANVVVTKDGRAKVLDFGLAKRLLDPAESESLRPSVTLTTTGMIVGTPHYLAPELLTGAKGDERSDLWALGVVLYEIAAGRMPFTGATMPELCVGILNQPMLPLPEELRGGLIAVIQRCLAKEPGQRFRHAAEVRAALEALRSEVPEPRPMARWHLPRWGLRAGIALVIAGVAALGGWLLWKRSAQFSPTAGVEARAWKQLTFMGNISDITLSPDGGTVAYVVEAGDTGPRVMVQDITGGEPLEVFKAERIMRIQWSPAGNDILVSGAPGKRWLIPRLGGPARSVDARAGPLASLSPDGAILAEARLNERRILLSPLAGGDTSWIHLEPQFTWLLDVDWSPDGSMLLFCVSDEAGSSIWTVRRDGRSQRKVYEAAADIPRARWAPPGGAIYCIRQLGQRGELIKVYVNRDGSPSRRSPRVLISEPGLATGVYGNARQAAFSGDGRRLVCARAVMYGNLWLWGLPHGQERRTEPRQLTFGTAHTTSPALSPDGERVAFLSNKGGAYNVHVLSLADGEARQLTFMEQGVYDLAWSPNGKSIAFTASDGDTVRVWQVDLEGGTTTPFVLTLVSKSEPDIAWWPGSKVLYQKPDNRNLNVLDPETGVEHSLVPNDSVGWMFTPAWSPDRKHVAVNWIRQRAGGRRGIWVVSTDDSGQRLVLPLRPGSEPIFRWANDGKALYCVPSESPWRLISVSFPTGDTTGVMEAPFEKLNEDQAWRDVDFTFDLRRFVYAASESKSDIWLMDNFDPEIN